MPRNRLRYNRVRICGVLRLAHVLLILTACHSNGGAVGQDFSALTQLAESALEGENVTLPVPGFEIRLLRSGVPIYHEVFGNWSLDRPANADSSTKTISGALMMAVVDSGAGGFTLDSHLADFLPEYGQPGLDEITIRQAFSHTSGLAGEDAGSLILLAPNITLRQAGFLISQGGIANGPPGSSFAYGGLSMQAAGAAAEVATGTAYVDLFAEHIAGPMEFSDTHFVIASDSNPRVAGGIESTATEFSRFMDMLLNEGVDRVTGQTILESASVAEMLTRQTNDGQAIVHSPTDNDRYGIGVWLDQLQQVGPTVDALAGGARGFHSWIDRDFELVFTLATDTTTFSNLELLSDLMHRAILEAISTPGDFNLDHRVDGTDLLAWQRGLSPDPLSASDLELWRTNYGNSEVGALVVPEPGTEAYFGALCCWMFTGPFFLSWFRSPGTARS